MTILPGKSTCRVGRAARCWSTQWTRGATVLLIVALCLPIAWQSAFAGSAPQLKPASYGYFDFPTCVRYALVHSQALLKSRIDIQIASSELKDAHSDMLPTVRLETTLQLSRPGGSTGNPINMRFYVYEYNPYGALLEIKSRGILVDIAKTTHKEKIADGIADIAAAFLEIEVRNRMIRAQRAIQKEWEEKVKYVKALAKRGKVDDLWVQRWEMSAMEFDQKTRELETEREELIDKLKAMIGYHPDYHLPLDTRDAENQILGGFNGTGLTFDQIQGGNYGLKILAKREQLASNNVAASYVAILPQPLVIVEGISNEVDRTSGFDFRIGIRYNLWDGFKGVRRIKRSKMQARQASLDRDEKSREAYQAYKKLRGSLVLANKEEGFLRRRMALAAKTTLQMRKLNEMSREDIQLKPGEDPEALPFTRVLNARIDEKMAKLQTIETGRLRVQALVELATLAGGLDRYNGRIRY